MDQRANRKAESAVRIMKSLFLKTYKEGGDPYEAMLEQSNTPCQDMGHSLAEMMFNRRTCSLIPSINNSPKDTIVKGCRDESKRSVKQSHDWQSLKLSELDIGQSVFLQHVEGHGGWEKGLRFWAPTLFKWKDRMEALTVEIMWT